MVCPQSRIALALIAVLLAAPGCSRTKYRLQADRDAYTVIAEHNVDPRWYEPDVGIEVDPRSRYFDPFDPDHSPMPPDDPSSHQYMLCVDGMKGWKHWDDDGERLELENPAWYQALRQYVPMTDDGAVELSLDSALRIAYVNSPDLQTQLETLYLSALDVTTERFRLDTQYFGGFDVVFRHDGRLSPGGESSILSVGRGAGTLGFPGGGSFGGPINVLQLSRRFATAGELVAGIANSFVWEFTNGNVNLASSIISATLVQPLLRGAGRDVALEQLTIVERALLANVRAYHQYRQGFYTQLAIGELGVGGPQRRGGFFGGTGLTGFTGQGAGGFGGVGGATFGGGGFGGGGGGTGGGTGFAGGGAGTVGGYIGLLQQLQQIRNTEDSLSLQLRTLSLLENYLDAGVIDLVQVDQFRQSIETERANLLQSRNGLELALDAFKTGTLGLPPDLPVELDDSLIRQFQFVTAEATKVQDAIAATQDVVGELPEDPGVDAVREVLQVAETLLEPLRSQLAAVEADLLQLEEAAPARERMMTDVERNLLARDREQLREALTDLMRHLDESDHNMMLLQKQLSETTKAATVRGLVAWLREVYRVTQGSILTQARARLEAISVDPIELQPYDAFAIAQANRLDLMNGRAALVDTWRLIAFNADALQGNLTVAVSGDMRTARDNPVSFRAENSTVRAGIQVDAPFTRLLERNNYRQSLIDYQRARRGFIQAQDGLYLSLRAQLRNIEQLRLNLEIQRRAVAISIRRVDLTREELNRPVPPPLPGQPPAQFGPTAATSLLTALSDLRNTQNNFMSVWLNYHAARMRLARDLGIMLLDEEGRWIELPIPAGIPVFEFDPADPLPPPVPDVWLQLADQLPVESDRASGTLEESSGESAGLPATKTLQDLSDPIGL